MTREEAHDLVMGVLSQPELDRVQGLANFGEVSLRAMDGWAPHAEDSQSMTRTLRDIGHYMAGVWAIQLNQTPGGLTHASLSEIVGPMGMGSRTRVHAMLVYLQFVGLIRPAPKGGDGRLRHYEPTTGLITLFRARFRRELTIIADLMPDLTQTLARWNEPGVFERFISAHGRFMSAGFMTYDPKASNLDVFSHRNGGLIILGQVITVAHSANSPFPPTGPTVVNLSEIARRSGVSRAQARGVLKAGESKGFLIPLPDGSTGFSPELRHNIEHLMAAYTLSLGWCAREAIRVRPI
ncbi:MAG: hypothetical protein Q7T61_15060 [Caulobacter sp.]|nr:hypothetical protein [Caulobacter sp.]